MAQGDRCLLVHGHFYQPPRENPWTGQIEPQSSAAPWENWNRRIADECYLPMARSRVYDASGKVVDLYNNYAHTSFNFGPTLLSWMRETHPGFLRHLADATVIDRTFALAQAYSHLIMPLADARDRHTQIVWGLREFHHRFGFHPEGMWLSECAIDPETVRALIDHGIRFVILSPHQASRARPFGHPEWQDVSMGAIDTRRAYRLFETDGAGRTHFDRHLDVVFYTPGLNLKVSFDHILTRPEELARELGYCYRAGSGEAQLVSIVTDGEIYGHHEKRGEEALTRLFRDIAPSLGLKVVSAGEFIRDNPPAWEVKLWEGEDRRGSSWSCEHGVGRWFRNCGCHPPIPPGWNQEWRDPLRDAFDAIRDRVRGVARRELGGLVWDMDDAFGDYIAIVLRPTVDERRTFARRHAQRPLDSAETGRLWRMLEALHNAMLMYTSCGWFFDELSGLEPVQNMRYALRAAELVQPHHDEDLAKLLEDALSRAKSNIPRFGDGGRVFRDLVLPTRYGDRELAAAMAVCLATDLPTDTLSWKIVDRTETVHYQDSKDYRLAWGSFVCHDERLDRFIRTAWAARVDDFDNTGVGLHGFEVIQGDLDREPGSVPVAAYTDFTWLRDAEKTHKGMTRQALIDHLYDVAVPFERLPGAVRGMLYRSFSGAEEEAILTEAATLGARAVPFLSRAHRHGARTPETIVNAVAAAFEQEILEEVFAAVEGMEFGAAASGEVDRHRRAAWDLGLNPSQDAPYRLLVHTGMELTHWLLHAADRDWFDSLQPTVLPGGGRWLAPRSQADHQLAYLAAGKFAQSLGEGLALLWSRLRDSGDPARNMLRIAPLPELLEYAERLGLGMRHATAMGIGYWDFLGRPLTRLIRHDPAGVMAGADGDRVRMIGRLLGFADAIVEKRIATAVRGGE